MIRDRGRIKWVSMMLPEHVKLLRKYNAGLDKVEKPILDEQDYDYFNQVISKAQQEGTALSFAYYQEGDIKEYTGSIYKFDVLKKEIKVIDEKTEQYILKLEDIVGIDRNP